MNKKVRILVNSKSYEVEIISRSREEVKFILENRIYSVEFENTAPQKSEEIKAKNKFADKSSNLTEKDGVIKITSPIPGLISKIAVSPGEEIRNGDLLLQIEAMKMQNSIFANASGVIITINVNKGDEVTEGYQLLEISVKK